MDDIVPSFDRLCFCGHTHLPGVFFRNDNGNWGFVTPEACGHQYDASSEKTIYNVGSVGQSRDSSSSACFVLHDDNRITFRRVDYDKTIKKINANHDFDNFLGKMLGQGR